MAWRDSEAARPGEVFFSLTLTETLRVGGDGSVEQEEEEEEEDRGAGSSSLPLTWEGSTRGCAEFQGGPGVHPWV